MDLSHLSLLRNDPQAAAEVLENALGGNMDAQFAAGLIYAEGRGVPIDLVQSFFWLSKAIDQGDADAKWLRDRVGAQMSPAEHDEAKKLVQADRQAGGGERPAASGRH